jgi:hypothetical protein
MAGSTDFVHNLQDYSSHIIASKSEGMKMEGLVARKKR